jgi:hypothetical protein
MVLAPLDRKTGALQVIIETPKGSWNKYSNKGGSYRDAHLI